MAVESDRATPAQALLTLSALALAAAAAARSPGLLFAAGTMATSVAWSISGQVTPCARELSRAGTDGRGRCCHDRLSSAHP